MADFCPHCGTSISGMSEIFCPVCRESLDNPPVSTAISPQQIRAQEARIALALKAVVILLFLAAFLAFEVIESKVGAIIAFAILLHASSLIWGKASIQSAHVRRLDQAAATSKHFDLDEAKYTISPRS
jgi:hypothetical protein